MKFNPLRAQTKADAERVDLGVSELPAEPANAGRASDLPVFPDDWIG